MLPLLDKKSDRRFSEPNRWGTNGLEEAALKPKLVVEVRYDKLEKHRFRHGTKLIRFRPDKDPAQCTWREVRPPRAADDLAVEDLLSVFFAARRLHALRLARHLREVRRVRRLALALRLLALDPLEQHAQVAHRLVDPRVQVAELGEARRHRRDREVLHRDVGQLVPANRRRHGRVGASAHRVRGQDRAVARVLVVVDEHLLAALLLPPRRRHEVGRAPLDLARERERTAAHDAELPVRLDAAVDVDAAVAARLRPADVADLVEHLVHDGGDLLRLREAGTRLRVDVDAQLVRLLRIARAATATRRTRASRGSRPRRRARAR